MSKLRIRIDTFHFLTNIAMIDWKKKSPPGVYIDIDVYRTKLMRIQPDHSTESELLPDIWYIVSLSIFASL